MLSFHVLEHTADGEPAASQQPQIARHHIRVRLA